MKRSAWKATTKIATFLRSRTVRAAARAFSSSANRGRAGDRPGQADPVGSTTGGNLRSGSSHESIDFYHLVGGLAPRPCNKTELARLAAREKTGMRTGR
jgi:hypothetical protein